MVATTIMGLNTDAKKVDYRQASIPLYYKSVFDLDDGDNHDFHVISAGKGRLTVCVDNPGDQTITVTVYGMHVATAAVDEVGVVSIGSFTITDANEIGYETINDLFPFYLVRVKPAAAATGGPECTVYVNIAAF